MKIKERYDTSWCTLEQVFIDRGGLPVVRHQEGETIEPGALQCETDSFWLSLVRMYDDAIGRVWKKK